MIDIQRLAILLTIVSLVVALATFFTGFETFLLLVNIALVSSVFISPAKPRVVIYKVLGVLAFYLFIGITYNNILSDEAFVLLANFNLYEFPAFALYALTVIVLALVLRREKHSIGLYMTFLITCLIISFSLILYFENTDLALFPHVLPTWGQFEQ